MAKTKEPSKGLTRKQLWRIWEQLKSNVWLEIAQDYKKDLGFITAGHNTAKGKCVHPEHDDNDPSFYIYPSKGYAKCFGCGYYETDPVRLVEHFMDGNKTEAINHLRDKRGISVLTKSALAELESQRLNQVMKQEVFSATHQLMCDAIADPTNTDYSFAKDTLDWLINARKIDKGIIHSLPLGIFPELGKLNAALTRRYHVNRRLFEAGKTTKEPDDVVQASFNYFKDYVHGDNLAGSVVLPLHVTPTDIGRLKLRKPKKDGSKDFLIPEDPFENMLGLFGLGWEMYKPFFTKKADVDYIFVTEGEFDVLSLMSRFMSGKGSAKFPIVSAGGRGGADYIEPIVEAVGCVKAYLIGDAPDSKGDEIVRSWLEGIKRVKTRVFTGWGEMPLAGDIDEAVDKFGEPKVTKAIFSDASSNYTTPGLWAMEAARDEIDDLEEKDFRTIIETGALHGKYLMNRLDRAEFVELLSSTYSVSASLLMREISSREDSEDGFVHSCADAIQQLFYVVGTEPSGSTRKLVFYHRENKQYHRLELDNDKSIAAEFAPIAGTIVSFIERHVGFPSFLETPENSEGNVRQKLDKQLRFFLREACLSLAEGVPNMETRQLRQGYHALTTAAGTNVEYIVCGPDIFRITREGDKVTYTALEGPSDPEHGVVFKLLSQTGTIEQPWLPGGMTVDRLEAAKKHDISKLYHDLVKVFDTAYRFKHHNITPRLLAALMLTFPISGALARPVLMFITGDTSSGKTSLLSTFCGLGYKGMQLLYAAQGSESYTMASVAAMADNDARLLALDEFESDDVKKGEAVGGILEMFRPLISGDATRTKGHPSGSQMTSQHFKMPVIFSAIQGAAKPQDANRMLLVEMQKRKNHDSPGTIMRDTFGADGIKDMANQIAMGMYPHAAKIAEYEKEIIDSFNAIQDKLPCKMEWRYGSSLFGVLALMRFVGEDWEKFLYDYVDAHAATLQRVSQVSESETTLTNMLRHPAIAQEGGRKATIAELLVSPETRCDINSSEYGAFYDPDQKLILLLLDTAIVKLLPYHQRKFGQTSVQIKNTLDRHPTALSATEIHRSGILRKVGNVLGAGIQQKDVSVFRAARWLEVEPEAPAEETPAKKETKNDKEISRDKVKDGTGGGDDDGGDLDW